MGEGLKRAVAAARATHSREFTVYVFTHQGVRKPWYTAYTMYQNEKGCIHRLQAISGAEAKKAAIAAHRLACTATYEPDLLASQPDGGGA